MSLPVWPTALEHRPLRDGLRLTQPHEPAHKTEMEGAARRKRPSATIRVAVFAMVWDWEQADYDLFRTFYHLTLADGTLRFTMPVFDGAGSAYVTRQCQFKDAYEWSRSGLRWRVSAELFVYGGPA